MATNNTQEEFYAACDRVVDCVAALESLLVVVDHPGDSRPQAAAWAIEETTRLIHVYQEATTAISPWIVDLVRACSQPVEFCGLSDTCCHATALGLVSHVLFGVATATDPDYDYNAHEWASYAPQITPENLTDVKEAASMRGPLSLLEGWGPLEPRDCQRLVTMLTRERLMLTEVRGPTDADYTAKTYTPGELRRMYDIRSQTTMKKRLDEQVIRNIKIGDKAYRIHVDDLPKSEP